MTALRGVTAADAIDSALVALRAAGVDSPRLDAELLLADALGTGRERLIMEPRLELSPAAARRFRDHVNRRAVRREPVAYIIGRRPFRHVELEVDARVLIPRPETELLVEVGLTLPPGAHVHDLGTGSGAIALALKHERRDLRVSASDVSAGAIALARANAERLGLEVELGVGDWSIPPDADALLANPPYVAEVDRASLPAELRHEPAAALFAGADGLDAIRAIAARVAACVARGARVARGAAPRLVALEVGAGQAPAVVELLSEAGLARVETRRDLAGIERVVIGCRS